MILETDRLVLTPITTGNYGDIYRMFTNDYIKKYLFDNITLSKDEVQSFIETSKDFFLRKKYGLWGVYTKDSNTLIGFTGLWHFFDENQPQLLYALLPEYTKLGYAKEASWKIIEYAFNQLRFNYLDASCDTPNISSHKVALSLGMKKVNEETVDNKPITFYRISKNEI
jgi:ribosomal-protein-alanine N-acetyltransferase